MACGDPGGAKYAGTWTVSIAEVMALSESFFLAFCSWRSEDLFGQSFSVAPPIEALSGPSLLFGRSGSCSVDLHVSHIKERPGCGPAL